MKSIIKSSFLFLSLTSKSHHSQLLPLSFSFKRLLSNNPMNILEPLSNPSVLKSSISTSLSSSSSKISAVESIETPHLTNQSLPDEIKNEKDIIPPKSSISTPSITSTYISPTHLNPLIFQSKIKEVKQSAHQDINYSSSTTYTPRAFTIRIADFDDIFAINKCNLNNLTENYTKDYYEKYLTLFSDYCFVAFDEKSNLVSYSSINFQYLFFLLT